MGAKVAVTDVARGTTRNLVTDEAGQYVAPALTAGTYKVHAEAMGFSALDRENILLEVNKTVRVDLTLSPGSQTQTVTVTEEIPAIDTTSATLGGTLTNQSITSLPLNGRNFLQLLELRPGVVDNPNLNGGGNGTATSTNGRRQGADVLLIEGVTQFDLATSNVLINGNNNGAAGATLPIDAIQEFNTQQNAPPEFGWRDGSVTSVGVKSGTNSLHGTAYAFGRHAAATDASPYAFDGIPTQSHIAREQFGATVGGPFVKDKLFWFLGLEMIRQTNHDLVSIDAPLSIANPGTPNPALSMVDACNAVKSSGGTISALSARLAGLDPTTCVVKPGSDTFMNVFHYNPTSSKRITSPTVANQPENNGLAKVDWNLTERHHLNGLFFIAKASQFSTSPLQPYWGSVTDGTVYQYSGSWTWTPTSSLVNDLRFGSASSKGGEVTKDVDRLPSDPYPDGYSMNTGVTNPAYGGFPCIIFGSTRTPTFSSLGTCGKPGTRGPQGQLNFRDSVSYLRGNHAFRFGGEVVFVKFDNSSLSNVQGTLNFTDSGSTPALVNFLTGTFPASSSSLNITGGDLSYGLRERWYSAFFGDTWRITPRVTLTPGVRYEYMEAPHEIENHLGTFDPNVTGGLAVVGPGLPHSRLFSPQKANFLPRGGVAWDIFGNGKTVLRGGIGLLSSFPSITTFVQSVPFGANLIDASGNVVVNHTGDPLSQASSFIIPYKASDLAGWNTGAPIFPNIGSGGAAPCSAPQVGTPCQTNAPDPNFKYTKSVQWNVDLQRAITNKLTIDIAYVANHGFDETAVIDLNAVPVGTGWNTPWTAAQITAFNATQSASNRLNAADAGFTSAQICIGQAFAGDIGKCRPNNDAIVAARPYNAKFPWFNYIIRPTAAFRSNYNGLQVSLDGRNYHGVSFLASYTYSHALDSWSRSSQTAPVVVNMNDIFYQYGNGDSDIRHRMRFSPSWQIPGIKSPAQMLEGWSLSGILALQGGFAWGATDQTTNDWAGNAENANANSRPNNGVWQTWNYFGPKSAFNSNATSGNNMPCYGKLTGCTPLSFTANPSTLSPALASVQQSCLTAAQAPYQGNTTLMALAVQSLNNNGCYIRDGGVMTPPAYGTLGNAGRNAFRGPGYFNVDMNVSKRWQLGERYSAQLRVEVFNLFNHVNYGLPGGDPTAGISPTAAGFGYTRSTVGNPRRMQFGLKLAF